MAGRLLANILNQLWTDAFVMWMRQLKCEKWSIKSSACYPWTILSQHPCWYVSFCATVSQLSHKQVKSALQFITDANILVPVSKACKTHCCRITKFFVMPQKVKNVSVFCPTTLTLSLCPIVQFHNVFGLYICISCSPWCQEVEQFSHFGSCNITSI